MLSIHSLRQQAWFHAEEQGLSNASRPNGRMMRVLRMRAVVHESCPESALVHRKPSGRSLTLDEIARVGGVSRFHMVRAFAEATGISVMRYVRARRLTKAARALAKGAPDILSLALEADYGSHEAFTRAFRDHFGVTPEAVRAATCLDKSQASGADHDGFNPARQSAAPALRNRQGRSSSPASPSATTTSDSGAGIPNQWQQFHQKVDDIPARIGKVAYGVCCNGDDAGNFDYIAGVEVSDFSDLPREFSRVRIPEQRYAVFSHSRAHLNHPPHRPRDLESVAAGIRPEGRRRAELRALRREIRSGHRQWRAGDLDAGEGVGRAEASRRRSELRFSWHAC